LSCYHRQYGHIHPSKKKNERYMKLRLISAGIILTGLATISAQAEDKSELKDQKQKVSYSYGVNYGNYLKRQSADLDLDVFVKGMKDALGSGTTLLDEKEIRDTITAYSKELRAKQEEKNKIIGEKNKKEGEAFLAENAKKPGIKTTPSGLQYKVLTDGSGPSPKSNEVVTVNYRGTLIDGTEFDSSYKRGQPYTTSVMGVVKGWTEALQMMKVGSKWQLFIPSELAYGPRAGGRDIGPNAVLIFEVELLGIKPPTPLPGAQPVTSDIIKVPSAEDLKKGAKIEVIKPDSNAPK
jgi:FKBP-type peptidyl-prolyl cis-trans isomerase FklB